MTITGEEVRTARESLGWKRQQLADALGLTIAQVARIETRGPKPEETDGLEELLRKGGVTTADVPESSSDPEFELPDPPVSEGAEGEADRRIVSTEWRGIKRGQTGVNYVNQPAVMQVEHPESRRDGRVELRLRSDTLRPPRQ